MTKRIGGPRHHPGYQQWKTTTTEARPTRQPYLRDTKARRVKWPDAAAADPQSLVHSGLNPRVEPVRGYGAIDGGLVIDDPSQYPDENPILSKPGGSEPTARRAGR